jgi:MoaA/NifB/PqqE/SkfB family radical SAM enzyme
LEVAAAANVVRRLAERFGVESVMTFGGEPLLYPDTVSAIHAAARDCGIPVRQIITNGFFSRDERRIDEVAKSLCDAGVNNILLSVDAFHQEHIPTEPVMCFADALLRHGAPSLRAHPAWLVNERHNNRDNIETKRLLKLFAGKGIYASEGNDIFPAGRALKNFPEYFDPPGKPDISVPCGSIPYTSRLDDINSVNINPNGSVALCSVTIGNIYDADILDIVDNYDPYKIPPVKALLDGGVTELLSFAESQGVSVDISDCNTACGVCRKAMSALRDTYRQYIETELDKAKLEAADPNTKWVSHDEIMNRLTAQ